LNSLLNEASGELFTWLADDDILHPNHIEILLRPLLNNISIKAAFSGYTSVSEDFAASLEKKLNVDEFFEFEFGNFVSIYAQRSISLIGCYGLFNRTSLIQSGGFLRLGSGFSPYSDTLIPLAVSKLGLIAVTETKTIYFRSHGESMSNSLSDLDAYLSAENDFVNVLSDLIVSEPVPSRLSMYTGFHSWFRENHLTVISRSTQNLPFDLLAWMRSCISNYKNFSRVGLYKSPRFLAGVIELSKHRLSNKLRR